MVFMLFFGSWLGLIGVFLAPPIFALFRVLYKHLYQPIADSH
jgi:predicted PurR-regulated permease PerM